LKSLPCALILGACLILVAADNVTAQEDVTPPELVSFDFSPDAVDNTGSGTVTVTVEVEDAGAGFQYGEVRFSSPSGIHRATWSFTGDNRIAGDEYHGTYRGTATIPAFSELGTWTVFYAYLMDSASYGSFHFTPELVGMGFPTELLVTGVEDLTPPELLYLDFSPDAVDNTGSGTVTVTVEVEDAGDTLCQPRRSCRGRGGEPVDS
jgi:hypothetical protein